MTAQAWSFWTINGTRTLIVYGDRALPAQTPQSSVSALDIQTVLIQSYPRHDGALVADHRRYFEGTAAPGTGRGVRYKARFIREHLYKDEDTGMRKFLPVLLPGATVADIPHAFQPTSATHYVVISLTSEGLRPLLRLLTGQPARVEPPLNPVIVLPPAYEYGDAIAGLCRILHIALHRAVHGLTIAAQEVPAPFVAILTGGIYLVAQLR